MNVLDSLLYLLVFFGGGIIVYFVYQLLNRPVGPNGKVPDGPPPRTIIIEKLFQIARQEEQKAEPEEVDQTLNDPRQNLWWSYQEIFLERNDEAALKLISAYRDFRSESSKETLSKLSLALQPFKDNSILDNFYFYFYSWLCEIEKSSYYEEEFHVDYSIINLEDVKDELKRTANQTQLGESVQLIRSEGFKVLEYFLALAQKNHELLRDQHRKIAWHRRAEELSNTQNKVDRIKEILSKKKDDSFFQREKQILLNFSYEILDLIASQRNRFKERKLAYKPLEIVGSPVLKLVEGESEMFEVSIKNLMNISCENFELIADASDGNLHFWSSIPKVINAREVLSINMQFTLTDIQKNNSQINLLASYQVNEQKIETSFKITTSPTQAPKQVVAPEKSAPVESNLSPAKTSSPKLKIENPYQTIPTGKVKTFQGRRGEIKRIKRLLNMPDDQLILLYGLARIGKTALLYNLMEDPDLSSKFVFIYINVERALITDNGLRYRKGSNEKKDLGNYYSSFLNQLYNAIRDGFDNQEVHFKEKETKDVISDLHFLLEHADKRRPIVLIIDEYQELEEEFKSTEDGKKLKIDTINFLKITLVGIKGVSLIFSGYETFENLKEYDATWAKKLSKGHEPIRIPPLDKAPSVSLVTQPMNRFGITFESSDLPKQIFKWTIGYPWFIQHICKMLFERKYNAEMDEFESKVITNEDIEFVKEELLSPQRRYLFHHITHSHFRTPELLEDILRCIGICIVQDNSFDKENIKYATFKDVYQVFEERFPNNQIRTEKAFRDQLEKLKSKGILEYDDVDVAIKIPIMAEWFSRN